MRTSTRVLFVFVLGAFSLLSAACGGDTPAAPDAGVEIDLGMNEEDAGQDMGPMRTPTLFGPCESAEDCPGENPVCRPNTNGWPGGFCTVPCTPPDREPCYDGNIYNHCLTQSDGGGSFCERRCQNGFDCQRSGYTCVDVGRFDQSGGVCIGVCSSNEQCGDGAECNVWSGQCTTTAPTSGGISGDTCTAADECRSGRCVTEGSGTNANGWLGGYCYGQCILPPGYNTNSIYAGGTSLPQGSCPEGDVCFPTSFAYPAQGDPGICFKGCDSNADCREGYQCVLSFNLGMGHVSTYDHGFCQPIDCNSTACPTGYTCRTVGTGSNVQHVCAL